MRVRTQLWMALACLACVAGNPAMAAPLDDAKLRLLSCDIDSAARADQEKAVAWLNQFAGSEPENGIAVPGPLQLGQACLRNVRVTGSYGVQLIQGEICNGRLEEFTGALAAIGIKLGKDVDGKVPGIVLGKVGAGRQYFITKGMLDMRTGKAVPMAGPNAFICTAGTGGAQ